MFVSLSYLANILIVLFYHFVSSLLFCFLASALSVPLLISPPNISTLFLSPLHSLLPSLYCSFVLFLTISTPSTSLLPSLSPSFLLPSTLLCLLSFPLDTSSLSLSPPPPPCLFPISLPSLFSSLSRSSFLSLSLSTPCSIFSSLYLSTPPPSLSSIPLPSLFPSPFPSLCPIPPSPLFPSLCRSSSVSVFFSTTFSPSLSNKTCWTRCSPQHITRGGLG